MKEAPIEGSFTLNSTGEQGITGDDFLLKMSFPGQSLENLWNPWAGSEWEVLFLYFYTQVPPRCAVSQNSPDLIRSHTRGRMEVHGENRKQEDGRDSLSFASFLVFFINAENLANTSFPAVRFRVLCPQLRVPWKVQSGSITDQQCLSRENTKQEEKKCLSLSRYKNENCSLNVFLIFPSSKLGATLSRSKAVDGLFSSWDGGPPGLAGLGSCPPEIKMMN